MNTKDYTVVDIITLKNHFIYDIIKIHYFLKLNLIQVFLVEPDQFQALFVFFRAY